MLIMLCIIVYLALGVGFTSLHMRWLGSNCRDGTSFILLLWPIGVCVFGVRLLVTWSQHLAGMPEREDENEGFRL